jgi:hypothetical protein
LFCYRKFGPEERDNVLPDPDIATLDRSANAMILDTQITPETQAEPAEWHVYRALVLYRNEHQAETDNEAYRAAMAAAHDSYIDRFTAQ